MSAVSLINFLLINSALCYGHSIVDNLTESPRNERICNTLGCFSATESILKLINQTADPCDDFYQFACGKYIDKYSSDNDGSRSSIWEETADNHKTKLIKSIENKISNNDPRTFHLLKSHYDVCRDRVKLKEMDTQKLLEILSEFNGWPVVVGKSWDYLFFNWKNLMYNLRQKGYTDSMNSLLTFSIEFDHINNTRYVINVDQARFGINQEYLLKGSEDQVVQAYYTYMVNIAEILGADRRRAEKELSESLNFEIDLAKISMTVQESKNKSRRYNPMTVEELEKKYSYIDWNEYFNEFLRPRHHIEPCEHIIVNDPIYFERLSGLLSKTPKRTIANYAIWKVVLETVPFMNKKFLNIKAEFDTSTGTYSQESRQSICVNHVYDQLPLAVGALYVRKNIDKNLKSDAQAMVNHLRESLKMTLKRISWMDAKTKRAAQKKLMSMYAHVAYPDELLDDVKIDGYFKNLKALPNSYLDSYLSIGLFEFDYDLQLFRRPVNKTDWVKHGSAAEFNAYYWVEQNSIDIYAAYMPKPFFDNTRPNYMNYGIIGSIIGHELTHGFDDQGSQYDENGNLKNWWDTQTYKKYRKRIQCFINQYNNYTVKDIGLHVNGEGTLGENIADNGGIKLSYLAYKEYEKRNGPEPRLPDLPYSPRQMFWIAAASIYCENYEPESMKDIVITEAHSPGEFRVIGSFSNMPEFSRDFECPIGSPMNPSEKCIVW